MAYKFDLEDFDKKLIEKLTRKPPTGGSLIERIRGAAGGLRKPLKPRLPKL